MTGETEKGSSISVISRRRPGKANFVIAQAAAAFRAKAQTTAAAFGLRDYELRALTLNDGGGSPPRYMAAPMSMADGARAAAAPLPTEGGESEIVVGLSRQVELR